MHLPVVNNDNSIFGLYAINDYKIKQIIKNPIVNPILNIKLKFLSLKFLHSVNVCFKKYFVPGSIKFGELSINKYFYFFKINYTYYLYG